MTQIYEKFAKKNIKNFDASSLPPCKTKLWQQLLRSYYITNIWRNSYTKILTELKPEVCGWIISDGIYDFKWFDGQQLPSYGKDIILDIENSEGEILQCLYVYFRSVIILFS